MLFSLGATSFINSHMGTDPLDVLCLGVQQHWHWSIGTTQSAFAALMLFIYCCIAGTKLPPLSPLCTFFICGYTIDGLRLLLTTSMVSVHPAWLLVAGVTLCTTGSALIIMSSFGIRAMDLVAMALMHRTSWPFWLYKGMLELLLLTTGYALGGPVGTGTVLFLVAVGWMIQPMMRCLHWCGIPNLSTIK